MGHQEMLCKKTGFARLLSELAQEIKVGQSSLLRVFSEPLTCLPTMAPAPPGRLTPTPALSQPPPPGLPVPAWPHSQVTGLRCSEAPEAPRLTEEGSGLTGPSPPGCAPFLLISPPVPFHGHSPVQGSAPATCLGCPPQGSVGQSPSPRPCVNPASSSHIDSLPPSSRRQPAPLLPAPRST